MGEMLYSVRVEWDGVVLRLFVDEEQAQEYVRRFVSAPDGGYEAIEHESGLGWLVREKVSGRLFDAMGSLENAPSRKRKAQGVTLDRMQGC